MLSPVNTELVDCQLGFSVIESPSVIEARDGEKEAIGSDNKRGWSGVV